MTYSKWKIEFYSHKNGKLLRHGRRAGEEKMYEIRVVSGQIALIAHVETIHL